MRGWNWGLRENISPNETEFKLISHKNPPVSLLNNPILSSPWHPSTKVAGAKNILIDFHLFFLHLCTQGGGRRILKEGEEDDEGKRLEMEKQNSLQ